jgi:copper chaperone CopZ
MTQELTLDVPTMTHALDQVEVCLILESVQGVTRVEANYHNQKAWVTCEESVRSEDLTSALLASKFQASLSVLI